MADSVNVKFRIDAEKNGHIGGSGLLKFLSGGALGPRLGMRVESRGAKQPSVREIMRKKTKKLENVC